MPKVRALTQLSRLEIEQLFKIARTKLKKDGIEVRLAPRSLDFGRLLIVIPKRSGKAAKRNQIRRRIKSIFYEEKLFELPFDWIILVKKEAIGMSFEKLKEIMTLAVRPDGARSAS